MIATKVFIPYLVHFETYHEFKREYQLVSCICVRQQPKTKFALKIDENEIRCREPGEHQPKHRDSCADTS